MILAGSVGPPEAPATRWNRIAREVVRHHVRLGGNEGSPAGRSSETRRWPGAGYAASGASGSETDRNPGSETDHTPGSKTDRRSRDRSWNANRERGSGDGSRT